MLRAYCETSAGQIYYESVGEGESIICLHGVDSSSWIFRNLGQALAEHYTVLTPDCLGFGISDPAPSDWNRIEDWAGSILDFMDSLKIARASILGHHMGARIALELAAAHPGRVKKLMLSGCGIFAPNTKKEFDPHSAWPREVQSTTLKERIAQFKPAHASPPEVPVSGLHIYEMWDSLVRSSPGVPPESIQAAFMARIRAFDKRCTFNSGVPNEYVFPVESRAAMVKTQAMLLVASKGCVCPPVCKPADAIAAKMKGCTVINIQEAGEMGLSVQAREYASAIRGFLKT